MTAFRAAIARIVLPEEIGVRLIRQDLPYKPSRGTHVVRLTEDFHGPHADLAPAFLDEGVDARPVDVLRKARPLYSRCTHRTALGVCVQRQLGEGVLCFGCRHVVWARGIDEDLAAVLDGGHFT